MSSKNPWEFNAKRVLVFSDVHQRLDWMHAILDKERNNYDKIVFLGDMFDTHHSTINSAGVRQTAKEYASMIDSPNNLILAGNHDIPYLECWADAKRFSNKKHIYNPCSGFSKSKAIEIAKELEPRHLEKIRLFCTVNGWLLSHAGISKSIFDLATNLKAKNESVFKALHRESLHAMTHLSSMSHKFLSVGYARGGDSDEGGMTWYDWTMEFEDHAPLPQLVGHTYDEHPRQIGRSFCIDTGFTYAIIHDDGYLELKNLSPTNTRDENDDLVWVSTEPKILKIG